MRVIIDVNDKLLELAVATQALSCDTVDEERTLDRIKMRLRKKPIVVHFEDLYDGWEDKELKQLEACIAALGVTQAIFDETKKQIFQKDGIK